MRTKPEDNSDSRRWFVLLPDSDRAALVGKGSRRSFRPGSTLFHEGDWSDFVVLLTRGRIKVTCGTTRGRDVVLGVCGPGELVGELSSIDGRPRSATATAVESIDAQVISAADFREFLMSHADATLALLMSICGRLRVSDRRQVEFVALDSVGRVARRLAEMADQYGVAEAGDIVRIDVPITQDELAGWTDLSREAVGKALHLLRSHGWIETGRRSVRVLDLSALRSRGM